MTDFIELVQEFSFNWETIKGLPRALWDWGIDWAKQNAYVVSLAVYSGIRALGTTVKTGNTGLFFSMGRATRVLEPGFVFKIPYFQKVVVMPSRARTLDVPNQKVTSSEGLVWFVDVNLIYRIIDIRKAVIEVDVLEKGMEQMLGLSVQEIVRAAGRDSMRLSGGLDEKLSEAMGARLEAWGVEVQSVGFTSIRPSPQTLKFTQQQHACEERAKTLVQMEQAGLAQGHALAMLGTVSIPRIRARRARQRESISRRKRRIMYWCLRAEKVGKGEIPASLRAGLRLGATARLRIKI